ncbi:hypothetical protein F5B22DRAFT_586033 [Xylaria bambusicola]|uniref:uncharacterized protein n=1 Tax=Xylaria bambusicola TaxID=326684 RepID=UPI002008BC8D|nr:uncharacterized protein F5B22DRAFT_586033 [Xylaria bambusicola]KAI0526486.1 hypothetical protein F5B22DRAFT_586033 [Xylaria bambusicola]
MAVSRSAGRVAYLSRTLSQVEWLVQGLLLHIPTCFCSRLYMPAVYVSICKRDSGVSLSFSRGCPGWLVNAIDLIPHAASAKGSLRVRPAGFPQRQDGNKTFGLTAALGQRRDKTSRLACRKPARLGLKLSRRVRRQGLYYAAWPLGRRSVLETAPVLCPAKLRPAAAFTVVCR